MPFNLGFQTKHILNPWSMHINPLKVSFNVFAILFKILSAHCEVFVISIAPAFSRFVSGKRGCCTCPFHVWGWYHGHFCSFGSQTVRCIYAVCLIDRIYPFTTLIWYSLSAMSLELQWSGRCQVQSSIFQIKKLFRLYNIKNFRFLLFHTVQSKSLQTLTW